MGMGNGRGSRENINKRECASILPSVFSPRMVIDIWFEGNKLLQLHCTALCTLRWSRAPSYASNRVCVCLFCQRELLARLTLTQPTNRPPIHPAIPSTCSSLRTTQHDRITQGKNQQQQQQQHYQVTPVLRMGSSVVLFFSFDPRATASAAWTPVTVQPAE